MKKKRFVIVAPKVMGGGAIVLHELSRELVRQGCDSKVFYYEDIYYINKKEYWLKWLKFTAKDVFRGKDRRFPQSSSLGRCKRKWLPFVGKRTIVVYPEVVYGNILHSKNVVRWLLYYNIYKDKPEAYGKQDLFFCYRKQFNDMALNPQYRMLFVLYFNFELYRTTNNGMRNGNCYVIHKGVNRIDLPKKFDGIVVDALPEMEKVRVFNECEFCFCYDMQSAYAIVATLCGCITILMPEKGKGIDYYRDKDDIRNYGVAYGMDEKEIEYAKRTLPMAKKQVEELMERGKKSVKEFINVCSDYFEKR